MVEIKCVTDAEIEPQGVQLRDRPDGIDGQVRRDDHVILRMCAYGDESRRTTRWVGDKNGAVVGIIDVIIVLDADACPDSEPNRAQKQIVRNTGDIFLPRI